MKKIIFYSILLNCYLLLIIKANAQNVFPDTGYVGIGVLNPQYQLDVNGNVRISQNLYVGGGIIISDKVNATTSVETATLKSASIQADSILMDSTKGFYGYSKFAGDVKLENKLKVNGDVQVNGNINTPGNISSNAIISNSIQTSQLTISEGTITTDTLHAIKQVIVNNSLKIAKEDINNFAEVSTKDTAVTLVLQKEEAAQVVIGSSTTQPAPPLPGQPKDKLIVIGNTQLQGDVNVSGNLTTDGSLTFASDKVISFQPTTGGFGNYCFGTGPPPADLDQCLAPPMPTNQFAFQGKYKSWGYAGNNSSNPINVMTMGFDGSNGIIDVAGTNPDGIAPRLLINYYCGKDVFINTSPTLGGNIQLTSTGSVGVGVFPPTAKLDVAGDLKISILPEYSSAINVIVEDGTGKIGKKNISSLGDNLGNHTATQNIILGDKWLTASTTENNGLHLSPNGNLTMIIGGNNSFEIKGGNEIPWRRGIGIPDEATSGQFNFYLNSWQTDAAFNFNSHTPAYNTTPEDPSTEVPAVTTNLFTILKNGKVGIGTTSPSSKLTIWDNTSDETQMIRLGAGSTADYKIYREMTTGTLIIQGTQDGYNNFSYKNDAGNVLFRILENGNIGVGATIPEASLHIKGTTLIKPASGNSILSMGSEEAGYGNLQLRYKYDGTNHRIGFTDGVGNWMMWSEYGTNNLCIPGKIKTQEIEVVVAVLPDYVFEKDYSLMNLKELENYIDSCKHLPEVPSAEYVKNNGMKLGEMNTLLLKKVEEQTLYIIYLKKRMDELEKLILSK